MGFSDVFSFFNTIRATPGQVKKNLTKDFKIALVGSSDMVAGFYEVLTAGIKTDSQDTDKTEAHSLVQTFPLPLSEEAVRNIKSDLAIFLLNLDDARKENFEFYQQLYKLNHPAICYVEEPDSNEGKLRIDNIRGELFLNHVEWLPSPSQEELAKKSENLLKLAKKFDMALAYRFPLFRQTMARKLIHNTSTQNMIIALASSLPTSLPVVGIIIGLLAVTGETTVLTINQLKLCLQLAGIYGMELNVFERLKELWPLVGSAIGMRTISRSLVGFIPLAGPSIKASIAYGGTYAVGETVRWFYEKGKKMSDEEKKAMMKQAMERALKTAEEYITRLRGQKPDNGENPLSSSDDIDFEKLEDELKDLEQELKEMESPAPAEEQEQENKE